MRLGNNISAFDDEAEFIHKYSNRNHVTIKNPESLVKQIIEIPFLDNQKEKLRVLSVLMADIKWTINSDCKVTYISPYIENCLGYDANLVIMKIASKYLMPSSVMSCLIELEELKDIMRTFKNTEPRKLFVELLPGEGSLKQIEITSSAVFDPVGNVVGISGLCNFLE